MGKKMTPPTDDKAMRENAMQQVQTDLRQCFKIAESAFGVEIDADYAIAVFGRVDLSDMPETWAAIVPLIKKARSIAEPLTKTPEDRKMVWEVFDRLYTEDNEEVDDAEKNLGESIKIAQNAFGDKATLSSALEIFDRLFEDGGDEDDEGDE